MPGLQRPIPAQAQQPQSTEEPEAEHARIRFRWTGDDIEPISMVVLPGEYVYAERLQGGLVYVVQQGERVVAVESFQDPRRRHSYYPEPERPHEVQQTEAGEFDVTVPGEILSTETFTGVSVRVYKIVEPPPEDELSIEGFEVFQKALTELYVVNGAEILERFSTLGRRN